MGRWGRAARWCAAFVAALAALWELHRLVHGLSRAQLATAWHDTPLAALGWSLTATAASFACLAAYEWFASQQIAPGRVPAWTAVRVGATAHAISNTLGFHALTAGILRYHLYRRQAIGKADVARLMTVVAACLAAGVMATLGLALAWSKAGVPGLGVATGLLLLLAWIVSAATTHMRLSAAWPRLDPTRVAGLLIVGVLETAAALAALYVLLPTNAGTPTLVQFVPVFIGATVLGIVSHAPGGIGVFEAAILAMLPGHAAELLVSLLGYRVIYNLLPFAAAASVLAITSLHQRRDGISWMVDSAGWPAAGAGTGVRASRCQPEDGRAGGWLR